MSDDKIEVHIHDGKNDPAANYSWLSIALHWIGAILVVVLFFTHGEDLIATHLSLGIVATLLLLYRVIYRWSRGFPRAHNQHPSLNFLARFIMISMLVTIFAVTLSGILLPLFEGSVYDLFGLVSWTAPYGGNQTIYSFLDTVHDISGHLIVPLFLLHVLGFAKHIFFDKYGHKARMLKSFQGGK